MLWPFLALLLMASSLAFAADPADIYQQEVPEMTTLECAKCHVQVFEDLRDSGGLHKQQCRDCHDRFHTFTPGVPWEERVPSCTGCHELPHGEEMNVCLECHKNAHAPLESLVAAEKLADMCDRCHAPQVDELAQTVSAHSEQSCYDCHQGERHGVRPECNACHEDAHAPFVDNAGCVSCHPPHMPTAISYDNKVPNAVCGGCHAEQLEIQQASDVKHKALACVICHAEEHGTIPECQLCHGNGPHNPALLKNFSSCGECPGNPHNLKLAEEVHFKPT
jgi:predicted CXXCH cytochrome family protein